MGKVYAARLPSKGDFSFRRRRRHEPTAAGAFKKGTALLGLVVAGSPARFPLAGQFAMVTP